MNFQRLAPFSSSMHFRFHSLALGVSLLLGATGCQPEPRPGETAPALTSESSRLRVANSLTTQALVLNAISTNPTADKLLVDDGLAPLFDPTTGDAYLQRQLRDKDAQHFMAYLVSCALEEGESIAWKDPDTGKTESWEGKAGLCPKWQWNAPSDECKRRISACILARNNAFGRRVELSIRGEDASQPGLFSLENPTRPVEYDPDLGGARVASFEDCESPSASMYRDCGWKADQLGRCAPGQTVRLGAGGRAPDQCSGSPLGSSSGTRMMLRVCDDLLGCDQGSTHLLAQSQGSCTTSAPAVTFTCPASGFFNVMAAPYDSTQAGTVSVEVGTGARYKLAESEVFSFREGAYYGDIFDPDALGAEVYVSERGEIVGKQQVVKGSVYKKMFSCQAPEWTNAAAYALHRVCALAETEENCAATPTGACIDWQNRKFPASKCVLDDGLVVKGDGDFEQCADPSGTVWKEPVTVFLHQPCELMPGVPSEYCIWKSPK